MFRHVCRFGLFWLFAVAATLSAVAAPGGGILRWHSMEPGAQNEYWSLLAYKGELALSYGPFIRCGVDPGRRAKTFGPFEYQRMSRGHWTIRSPSWVPVTLLALPVPLCLTTWWRRRLAQQRIHAGQCAVCGYNMTGNVSGVCPECGTPRHAIVPL